jgi:tetratricopeptide (TPR) repeat protein
MRLGLFTLIAGLASIPTAVADVTTLNGVHVTVNANRGTSTEHAPVGPPPTEGDAETEHFFGLTSDLVYAVLVAEVASQRGDQRMAFAQFLNASRLALDPALAERATRAAIALNDADAIKEAIDTWLELAPDSMTAHQIAAYVKLEADDVSGALGHLRKIISLAAEQGEDGFLQAARLVNKLKPVERRLQLMETLTADDPENADAWFARAMVAAGADRFDQSREAARRAAELRPGWNEPRLFLVQVLLSQGRREEARSTLETFVEESPDDHGLRMLYAQLLVDEKEFSHARDVFEYVLRDKPKEPDVLFALGILSLQLEDLDAARDYFTRLRTTGKRQDDSAYYLGQSEELAGNLEAAISWYMKVSGERGLDAQIRIARVRAEQGSVERAREILQQLRDQWPDDAVTLYLVEAEMLRDLDLPREAMAVYDDALNAFPETPDLLYARALQAASLNRLEILERDLKAVIEKNPDHADALNALGYTLADQTDRYQEALGYVQRALALKPEDPAVLDSMGWVQYRLGNLESAREFLRKALELMPDGEIAAHLGEVLWAMGERDRAWRIWEDALVRDPKHAYLLRVIGRHRVTSSSPDP